MFPYYEKRLDEIKNIDVNKLTEETKVIIFCIINYYNYDFLFDLENLSTLKECKPLKTPLIIHGDTSKEEDIYKKMNVIF